MKPQIFLISEHYVTADIEGRLPSLSDFNRDLIAQTTWSP